MKNTSMQPDDWDLLVKLAKRSGVGPENVTTLQQRWEHKDHPSGPLTLLAGHSKAIELLLSRWMSLDVAEQFVNAGAQPLVIGPEPARLQPPVGHWPILVQQSMKGHVLALVASDALTHSLTAALSSFGVINQAVLVSFIDQPLNSGERKLARSLSSLASVGKCLVVALPGYEIAEKEVNEAAALARRILESEGFTGNRCGGSAVWFTEDSHTRAGALSNLDELLLCDPSANDHNEVLLAALDGLIKVIEKAGNLEPLSRPLDEDERKELRDQFEALVSRLGRKLMDSAKQGAFGDNEALSKASKEIVKEWTARSGSGTETMNYIESVRPGAKFGFRSEVEDFSVNLKLNLDVLAHSKVERNSRKSSSKVNRSVVALLAAVLGYLGGSELVRLIFQQWLQGLLSILCGGLLAVVSAIAGWFLAGCFGKEKKRQSSDHVSSASDLLPKPLIVGWDTMEQHLNAWFLGVITAPPESIAQHCADLRARLSIPKP